MCLCVFVFVMLPHTHARARPHTSPHLPQSMRFPYWFNPQTRDQLQSVFTSIVIWLGLRGLISSQFHPVGPFISRPKLIHQRLKARQEKPCEERGWIFLLMSGEEKKKKKSRGEQESGSGVFLIYPPMKKYIIIRNKIDLKVSQWSCNLSVASFSHLFILLPPPTSHQNPSSPKPFILPVREKVL